MQLSQVPSQQLAMQLKQVLSPQLIQQMNRFQLSYHELVDDIKSAALDNPFLIIKQPDKLLTQPQTEEGPTFLDMAHHQDTLKDVLRQQLELAFINDQDKEIALQLIDGIDGRGYLPDYDALKKAIIKETGVADRKVTEVLRVIQSFEPEGVGARSLKECLLIQLDEQAFDSEALKTIIKQVIQEHLDDIAENNVQKVADACGIDEEEIEDIVMLIRDNFNPNPGAGYAPESFTHHVTPSFRVEVIGDEVVLANLEEEEGIKLSLSGEMLASLHDPKLDTKTKQQLKRHYQQAKTWIEHLEKRRETSQKIVEKIIEKQELFIRKGEVFLQPLLQKELVTFSDFSPSTISRLLNAKYIETPWGTKPLKQLCPRRYFGHTKNKLSQMIKHLIELDPKASDQVIANRLHQQGIPIARRTVTKYRLELGLKSSYEREG